VTRSSEKSPVSRSMKRLLAFLCLALALGCGGGREGPPRQAILILLDAAVPERFSAYGYERETTPEIDALAERGFVFERHFAQATNTRGSLPTLLYSRYFSVPIFPISKRVPLETPGDLFLHPDEHSISLPAAFSRAGIPSAAMSAHLWLKEGTRIAEEFDELHNLSTELDYDGRYGFPRADQVIDYTIDWLESRIDDDFFLYLHLMDTHFPHRFEEDAQAFFGAPSYEGETFRPDGSPKDLDQPLTGEDRAYLDALYDGSLRFTDRHLGRLFAFLKSEGRLDDVLVAITSDHGEHLLETPPRFSHEGPWYDAVGQVPLILFQPSSLAPGTWGGLSEGVDVMPTILEAMGISVGTWDKRMDGVDLRELVAGEQAPKDHVFMPRGVRSERWKLVFTNLPEELLGGEAPPLEAIRGELYDLEADPEERHDLFAERPEVVSELLTTYRERLRVPYRRYRSTRVDAPPPGPFAVGSARFGYEPEAPRLLTDYVEPPREEILARADDEGWVRVWHWEWYGLYAAGGAEPLAVTFPLPSGDYALSAELCGRFFIEPPGAERFEVDARGYACADRRFTSVPVGRIEVRGGQFQAVLIPDSDEGTHAGLYRLGFRPLGPGDSGEETEEDRERLERLKTLGYVSDG